MAILNYSKDGKQLYRVYVQARGKVDTSLRVQKNKFNLESFKEAQKEEKKLINHIAEEINKIEGRGLKWEEIIYRWEIYASKGLLGDRQKECSYIYDHVNRLKRYTKPWFGRVASELNKGDGRYVLGLISENNGNSSLLNKLKCSVNVVFKWAIEQKLVIGAHVSPTEGINVVDKVERVPKILTLEEIRTLLKAAKEKQHPWYHIWSFAFLTGMRSGELKALQWKDIDYERKIISVSKSVCNATKAIKCTKSGYWRNVPISNELLQIITELQKGREYGPDDFVLPRLGPWGNGEAGKVLRAFLVKCDINKNIVFHTLRACFATHMLASAVDQATVMKIGGWKDIKTFQIYLRLAGVEIKGATDVLKVIPQLDSLITKDNVINFFDHKTENV